jgi:hypothetical protein
MTVRICPVDGCGAPVRAGHLMCRVCWARVPRRLAIEVNESWRAFRRVTSLALFGDARARYEMASQAAVDAATAARRAKP